MEVTVYEGAVRRVAVVRGEAVLLETAQDALDVMIVLRGAVPARRTGSRAQAGRSLKAGAAGKITKFICGHEGDQSIRPQGADSDARRANTTILSGVQGHPAMAFLHDCRPRRPGSVRDKYSAVIKAEGIPARGAGPLSRMNVGKGRTEGLSAFPPVRLAQTGRAR